MAKVEIFPNRDNMPTIKTGHLVLHSKTVFLVGARSNMPNAFFCVDIKTGHQHCIMEDALTYFEGKVILSND